MFFFLIYYRIFFALLLTTILVCTIIDKCMRMKAERCKEDSAERDVDEKGQKYILPKMNGGVKDEVPMVESEIYEGSDSLGHDNKAYMNNNGDLEGECCAQLIILFYFMFYS